MICKYSSWPDGSAFLTSKKNPTLTVVRERDNKRWQNHCYFKIKCGKPYMNKSMDDFKYFAVFENHVRRGVYTYSEIRANLINTHDECNLVAYPRWTTKRRKFNGGK